MSDLSDFSDADFDLSDTDTKKTSKRNAALSPKKGASPTKDKGKAADKKDEKKEDKKDEKKEDKNDDDKKDDDKEKAASKTGTTAAKPKKAGSQDSTTGVISPPDFFFSSIVHDGQIFQARKEHLVVELNDTIYIWGGVEEDKIFDDLINFNPVTNTFNSVSVQGTGPSARVGASLVSAVSDDGRKVLTLWGGENQNSELTNQTWNFDTKSCKWTKATTKSSPSARKGHSMCVSGELLYLWGGMDAGGVRDDGYVLKGDSWTKLKGDGQPAPRCFHTGTMAPTASGDCMFIFGGDLSGGGRPTNELWRYTVKGSRWQLIDDASGEAPVARFKHASAFYDERIWISGGQTAGWFSTYAVSDFFVYDVSANYWFKCDVAAKQLGYHANFGSLALVPQNKALYIFGGSDSYGKPTSDVYRLAPVCTTVSVLDLKRELTQTTLEIMEVKSEMGKYAASADRVVNLVNTLENSVESVLGRMEGVNKNIEGFQVDLKTLAEHNSTYHESVEQVRQRLNGLEQKLTSLAQLERKFEIMETSIQDILRKLDEKAEASAVRNIANRLNVD
ncbi:kelch repeat-containing protein [Cystoisospora suis]|uniref:Kelch repeat-containing protein n=1 Tax=Cystoisospora suis TaxID=483139 RepID=A0A2C6KHX7_9APIC|nr:kelch repeat-containing protein [Cystoisospora suis]